MGVADCYPQTKAAGKDPEPAVVAASQLREALREGTRCPPQKEPRATYALGVHRKVLPQPVGPNNPGDVGAVGGWGDAVRTHRI